MSQIPQYIIDRIRRTAPEKAAIVPGSTPVVSFGNATSARVATLGLNPSKREFLDKAGLELVGGERRLATHQSLGLVGLTSVSPEKVGAVLAECNGYFNKNPYCPWFDQLEQIIKPSGFSYYDGSACHLDLVQWATNPTWRHLPVAVREQLIVADAEFLEQQLLNEKFRFILVNGTGVRLQLENRFGASLTELAPIMGLGPNATRIYEGSVLDRVYVVAWSTNLQGSHGVTKELRAELARRVSGIVAKYVAGGSKLKSKSQEISRVSMGPPLQNPGRAGLYPRSDCWSLMSLRLQWRQLESSAQYAWHRDVLVQSLPAKSEAVDFDGDFLQELGRSDREAGKPISRENDDPTVVKFNKDGPVVGPSPDRRP